MKISIVTISYNQARFLERCIRSVIEQDYDDIEYIVVDPGSTDGSREIIERYRDRISKIIFEPDKGPVDGLNKGFSHATGVIYGYINADDALLSGAISEMVKTFNKNPEFNIIIGHGYVVDPDGVVLRCFRSAKFNAKRFALGAGVVIQQSTFFRREAYMKVDGFNDKNKTSWDAELLLQMALTGAKVKIINRYWSLFTIHPDSLTGSQSLPNEVRANHARYFEMVMGRKEKRIDLFWRKVAWLQRWGLDPFGVLRRLLDSCIGPPCRTFPL